MLAIGSRVALLFAATSMVFAIGFTATPSEATAVARATAVTTKASSIQTSMLERAHKKRSKKCSKHSTRRSIKPEKKAGTRSFSSKRCSTKIRRTKPAQRTRPSQRVAPAPKPQTRVSTTTVFGLAANGEAELRAAEARIGLTAGVVGVFADFRQSFPTAASKSATARGATLLISWEPWDWTIKNQNQPAYALDRITDGDHDAYIRKFARDAAATKRPLFIRFAAEMNGDWHVWSTGSNGNGPGDYIAAYRHVVDVSRAAGAHNIKWMFNPIVTYEGSTPLTSLYPGNDYVDWVALDGYNWGSLKWGWQSFDDIFSMGLAEIKAVAPGKPLAIAEIGSVPGSERAAWITDSFAKAHANGVRMLVWFEHNKETDWRLSSDPNSSAAAKAAATQPGWVSGNNYPVVKTALGL